MGKRTLEQNTQKNNSVPVEWTVNLNYCGSDVFFLHHKESNVATLTRMLSHWPLHATHQTTSQLQKEAKMNSQSEMPQMS